MLLPPSGYRVVLYKKRCLVCRLAFEDTFWNLPEAPYFNMPLKIFFYNETKLLSTLDIPGILLSLLIKLGERL